MQRQHAGASFGHEKDKALPYTMTWRDLEDTELCERPDSEDPTMHPSLRGFSVER
jgi:hypothetical protein